MTGCYCGNTGVVERIPKLESAQKVDPGEANSPAALTVIQIKLNNNNDKDVFCIPRVAMSSYNIQDQ